MQCHRIHLIEEGRPCSSRYILSERYVELHPGREADDRVQSYDIRVSIDIGLQMAD